MMHTHLTNDSYVKISLDQGIDLCMRVCVCLCVHICHLKQQHILGISFIIIKLTKT